MNDFTRPGGRLATLALHAKIVYSTFALFTLAALIVSMILAHDMVGIDLSRIDSYYAGVSHKTEPYVEPSIPIQMPQDLGGAEEPYAMPKRKLLEVTHFHLFSMPLYLLVLSHLYALTSAKTKAKTFWIGIATVSTLAHMIAPWVARCQASGSTWLYALSGAGQLVSYGWMCLAPLIDMWSKSAADVSPA